MKTIEEIESQLQQVQNKMDQSVPILFKQPNILLKKTLFQFLLNFMFADYDTRESVYLPNKRGQKRLQCYGGARRSATDLYRLFNNTYKNFGLEKITLVDMITYLHYMCKKNYICADYCYDVHKRVYFSFSKSPSKNASFKLFYNKTNCDGKIVRDNLGMLKEDYDLLLEHYPVDEKKELIQIAQLTKAA